MVPSPGLKLSHLRQKAEAKRKNVGQPTALASSSCKMTEGGLARVDCDALVEENREPSQRQDRVPKALN